MAISYTNKLSFRIESGLSLKLFVKQIEKHMLPSFLKGVAAEVRGGLAR